jgi:hypothetical protein
MPTTFTRCLWHVDSNGINDFASLSADPTYPAQLPFSLSCRHLATFALCSGEKRYNVKLRAAISIISNRDFAEFRRPNLPRRSGNGAAGGSLADFRGQPRPSRPERDRLGVVGDGAEPMRGAAYEPEAVAVLGIRLFANAGHLIMGSQVRVLVRPPGLSDRHSGSRMMRHLRAFDRARGRYLDLNQDGISKRR